ncbi:MAG: oligoendopeptidase F [Anaerolineae bacterium]
MMSSNKLLPRDQMPAERQWDLTTIFKTDEAWTAACETVLAAFDQLAAYQGKLNDSADTLADFLELSADIGRTTQQINMYAALKSAGDATDQTASGQASRSNTLMAQYGASVAFAEPELMALGRKQLDQLQSESDRLAMYTRYFDWLDDLRPHTRSAEVEQLLAQLEDPFNTPYTIYGQLADADLTFKPAVDSQGIEHPVAQSTFLPLIVHPDRKIRKTTYESFSDAHLAHKNTLSQVLAGSIKQDVFRAQARGYDSSLAASLDPKRVPHEVFHNLIDVFKRKLPVWHRYWRLRRKILGVETLQEYDVKAPLTAETLEIPYEQAVEWISESMRPLGQDYVNTLRYGAFEGRWIDVYPNQGKINTAFSIGVQGINPFIMLNHSDDVFGMSILAHELGHSMHSWYALRHQPFIYSNGGVFAGEVASNFNQALLRRYLLENQTSPQFQIALLEEMMSNYHRYFFLMPTLARFELELHQRVERGDPLTTQSMLDLMADLFEEGYGGEVEIDRDRHGITWSQFIHLYNNYYIFQYMTGIAGAAALVDKVIAEGEPAAATYIDFLKLGGYEYPIDALRFAGVDLASPEPIEAAFTIMEQAIDRLEALMLKPTNSQE